MDFPRFCVSVELLHFVGTVTIPYDISDIFDIFLTFLSMSEFP
jgi:hypothetical protein